MTEVKKYERHNILNNHKWFDEETLCFWFNKINDRLNYLNPLLDELKSLKMDVRDVSGELAQELFEIKELKKLLEQYKIK